eukprot:Gregarina_sp_Pseudo_9__772@NODE_1495_length_1547_cov_28_313660_g1385_i0_p2_GENE_NODE_1495_length_1547_cov_28_313660_g1385_i0NODE_1495_length_1547_cov_28_313660_g1385_i0_p2_ORF_typecomplete_len136_score28_37DUF5527/PF17665_1/0_36_NODE_1495_length_1547_cov_28_313660_g1385_i0271678
MSAASEPFLTRLGATLAGLKDARVLQPFIWFSNTCLYEPMRKVIFYNAATEKFADEHPTITALSILLVIYILVLLLAHLTHMIFLKVHGPSRWHLAAEDLRASRQPAPKRRASRKESAPKEPAARGGRRKSKKDQ